jgi:ElaB/YqjD/DUF883 family membrane-anchored ribosome-binding protein
MKANDIKDKPFQTQRDAPEDFDEAISNLAQKAQTLKDTAQEWQRQATETASKAAKATDAYVRESPWRAVAWAAAACYLIGYIRGRSRR